MPALLRAGAEQKSTFDIVLYSVRVWNWNPVMQWQKWISSDQHRDYSAVLFYFVDHIHMILSPIFVKIASLELGQGLNSFPPCAAYMCQWIGSALVQIMACRLFSHTPFSRTFLVYCQFQGNFNTDTKIFFPENVSENIVCEMAAILTRGRWVNCPGTSEITLDNIGKRDQ